MTLGWSQVQLFSQKPLRVELKGKESGPCRLPNRKNASTCSVSTCCTAGAVGRIRAFDEPERFADAGLLRLEGHRRLTL